ncbi:MAG: hypothetical protein QM765_35785 [Myxococcales bacterium]
MTATLRKGGWTSTQRKNLSAIRYPHVSDPPDVVLTRDAAWAALVAANAAEGTPPAQLDVATELKRLRQLFSYHQAAPSYHDDLAKALVSFWMATDPAFSLQLMVPAKSLDGLEGYDYFTGGEWRIWPQLKRHLFALDEATFEKLRAAVEPTYRKLLASDDWDGRKRALWLLYAFSRNPAWANEYAQKAEYVEDVVFASITDPAVALQASEKSSTTLVKWWVLDVVENLGRAAAPALDKLAGKASRADQRKVIESAMKIALKLEDAPAGDAAPAAPAGKAKAKKGAAAPAADAPALPACLTDPFAAPKAAPKKRAAPAASVAKGPPEVLVLTLSKDETKALQEKDAAREYQDEKALSMLELHQRDLKSHVWYAINELEQLSTAKRLAWVRALDADARAVLMRDRNGLKPEAFVSLLAFPAKTDEDRALVTELALLAPPEKIAELAKSMHSPALIARLAEVAAGKKKAAADAAKEWLTAHPAEAIAALVPAAAVASGKAREPLVAAVDTLRDAGHGAAIDAAAPGADLSAEPAVLKAPRSLPPFFAMAKLPPLALKAGGELPAELTQKIGQMLSVSPIDPPMEGLTALVGLTTDESRQTFAWALLEAWLTKGAPAQDRWPVEWLGFLAGDGVSERLAGLCLEWARAGQHQRSFWAVDVLGRLGTDRAARALIEARVRQPVSGPGRALPGGAGGVGQQAWTRRGRAARRAGPRPGHRAGQAAGDR